MSKCVFLNPRTCGIYKDGGPRYKTDPETGRRTDLIDNELLDHVEAFLAGSRVDGLVKVSNAEVFRKNILVPMYYDERFNAPIRDVLGRLGVEGVTIGELIEQGALSVRGGHGSPGNDQRSGTVPYIKVSDIRGMRMNINPTNMIPLNVAKRFWRGDVSGLQAWDLITPNRASSNIGEFAVLLPGEEQVVVTKEVFVLRLLEAAGFDHFYLLWALCLRAVRDQWRRVALMQTNREDCGNRYREIVIPKPPNAEWAEKASVAFREYFQTIAIAKPRFVETIGQDGHVYIASVFSSAAQPIDADADDEDCRSAQD